MDKDLQNRFDTASTYTDWREFRRHVGAETDGFQALKRMELDLSNAKKPDSVQWGILNWLMGRHERGAEILESVNTPLGTLVRAACLLEIDRFDEAQKLVCKKPDEPNRVAAKMLLAEIHLRTGTLEACEETLGELQEQMPHAVRELAEALEREKHAFGTTSLSVQTVVDAVDGLLKQHDVPEEEGVEWAEFFYLRGALWDEREGANTPQRTWFIRQAIMDYSIAMYLDDAHPGALYRLAYYADLYGDDEMALTFYETLKEGSPLYENTLINLGVLYEDREEYDKARECYQLVLRKNPTHRRSRMYLKDAEASMTMYYDEDQERREDKRAQVLRTPVTEFELSVRSRNCLARMKIDSLGDLIKKTEQELLSYKNFGETSLQEIKGILGTKGLRLGMASGEEEPKVEAAKGSREEVLTKPVTDLDLSVRIRKVMERLNIATVGELIAHREADLTQLKNFGKTSLAELKKKLSDLGLSLAS